MAQNFVEYLKENFDSLFNKKGNEKKKNDALAELEAYLNGGGENVLPDKPVLPDAPKYEEINYDAPTDDEIKENAQSGLEEYKNLTLDSIAKEIEALEKKYNSEKVNADNALKSKNEGIEEAYTEAKKNTDNDLLKRGIARSSIAANKGAELEGAQAKMKSDVLNEYTRDIERLDGEIGGLEAKRGKALDDFNITYAAKLTKSINELKGERETKITEALKYNNTIKEKEHNANVDKVMNESDLYGDALSQKEKENKIKGEAGSEARQAETYNMMEKALSGMNAVDARKVLNENPIFKANLNEEYFYRLYDKFAR